MFADTFPNIVPLRAIALQSLFLLMAIAIEAAVFQRQVGLEPKLSVYQAATINLFCVVLGWLALFIFLDFSDLLPAGLQVPLFSFIFFDQWSSETATLLIVACFIIFFVSLGIKLLGLIGLRLITQPDKKADAKPDAKSDASPDATPGAEAAFFKDDRRDLNRFRSDLDTAPPSGPFFSKEDKREPNKLRSDIVTLMLANACSYSAILVALVIRQALL